MKKGKLIGKISGIALVLVMIGAMLGGLPALVSKVEASPATIYVPDNYPTIQAAVDAASPGDTIIVRDGTYGESIVIGKDHLTIRSENGVNHIRGGVKFEVTADYVSISGFIVIGGHQPNSERGWPGIRLYASYCNISSNYITYSDPGIELGGNGSNITDNNISGNIGDGIFFTSSNDNIIANNIIDSNSCNGIYFLGVGYNTITNNTISNNYRGIVVGSYNTLVNNSVSNNGYAGIVLYGGNNTLKGNTISGSSFNFGFEMEAASIEQWYVQDIDTSNTVNGKPIYYWINQRDRQFPEDAGFVAAVNSTNITVKGLTLTNNWEGVLFVNTSNSRIEDVKVASNARGIALWNSSNNTLTNSTISNNGGCYYMGGLSYGGGIFLINSSGNLLTNTTVSNNQGSYYPWVGMYGGGINLYSSSSNIIYRNNFINNNKAYDWYPDNTWNSPEEMTYTYNGSTYTNYLGNYWSGYSGNDADGDGIGDTPYPIYSDADNYPLVEPFENYVIGEDTTSPTVSCVSPEDSATDVATDAVITVTFTEAMDETTIDETSFTLAGSAVSGTVTYDPSTYTATFTPDADLEYDHEYTATLSAAITDLAGNPLAEPYTWSFTSELAPSQPPEGLLDVKFFSQKDPAWSGNYLDDSPYTIGNSGCALTSLAMIVKYFGYDTDPAKLNTSLTEAGGIDVLGNICDWSKVEDVSNEQVKWIDSVEASWSRIDQELGEGYPVICSVKTPLDPPLDIHFIVFIGKVGNKYYFLDPLDVEKNIREWPKGKYNYTIDANRRLKIYRPNRPPICAIKLQKNGMSLDNVDVGEVFGIYVGNSTDDFAIKEVRFSSDDFQDGTPTGEWTEWYAWDISLGDWNAVSKTKAWSFATGGKKEVWAETEDDGGNVAQNHANIFANPGYAIIVASQGPWKSTFDHCANNAYKVLRNLGFNDENIFYLNDSPQDIDSDGDDEVDAPASVTHFVNSLNEIRARTNGHPPLLVIYLVGHGVTDAFILDGADLNVIELKENLDEFSSESRMLIYINSCYSGCFIAPTYPEQSISAANRIIVTAAHNDQEWGITDWYFGERHAFSWVRSSDRFWEALNKGLNVKDAFTYRPTPGDNWHMWLDDSGDKIGSPPDNLGEDGKLAGTTIIGLPGTEDLQLTPWQLIWKHSPGELRVYDSQNRVTGLINGEVKEEIPDSLYDEENEIVALFSPSDINHYEVTGTDEGTYGLEIDSIDGADAINFTATNIPTATGTVHQYTIDWDALSRGEKGVTVQVDSDGDGTFERTFASDGELTRNEFVPQSGCFIATAAYGTPMAKEIQILREFRGEYLLTNPLGQALVDFYYKVSPPMAEFITEHPVLKPIVRAGLLPVVTMSAVVVNTTTAEKIAIVSLLVLVSVAVAVWVTRRRGRDPEHS